MRETERRSSAQRRAFFRKSLSLPIKASLFALPDRREMPEDRRIPVDVVNLSGGGMLLIITLPSRTSNLVCEGALVDISLPIGQSPLPVRILGRVVRTQRQRRGRLGFAVEFILLSYKEADAIVKLISSPAARKALREKK